MRGLGNNKSNLVLELLRCPSCFHFQTATGKTVQNADVLERRENEMSKKKAEETNTENRKRSAEEDGYAVTHPSLINAVISGDQRAFDRFYAIYKPLIVKFCTVRGLTPTEVEDMTQDIMFAFSQKTQQGFELDPTLKFRNYIYGITSNMVKNLLRKKYKAQQIFGPNFSETQDDDETNVSTEHNADWVQITGTFKHPYQEQEEAEWDAHLAAAAKKELRTRIKPIEFQVFSMMEEGKHPQEIAELLDISLSSVYNHKKEACNRYKKILDELNGNSQSYRDR